MSKGASQEILDRDWVHEWLPAPRDQWCAGLPIVAKRGLYPEERAQLRTQRARFRVYLTLGVLLLVAPFPMVAVAVVQSAKHPHPHVSPLGFALSLVFLLCVAPCAGALVTLRSAKRLRAIRRERDASQLLRFEGQLAGPWFRRGPLAALLRSGDVRLGASHVLEVLAPSGRLVRVDGRIPRARLFLGISDVAVPPKRAEVAAQWLKPVKMRDGQHVLQGSRSLDDDEEREIARHVTRVTWRAATGIVSVLACVAIFCFVARSTWPFAMRAVVCVATGIVTILDGTKIAAVLRLLLGMRRDLRERKIVIVGLPVKGEAGVTQPPVEILVNSRLQWTRGGRPAAWRAGVYTAPVAF
ncbi:MAG: hypothetical protein ACLQVI_03595 [Polyangiaceae bacterium]